MRRSINSLRDLPTIERIQVANLQKELMRQNSLMTMKEAAIRALAILNLPPLEDTQ